jgi:hypothetical protein
MKLIHLVFVACALTGCALFPDGAADTASDAVDTLEQVCETGLLEHPAVVAQAEALGLPNASALAQYLCAIPDVVNVFRDRAPGAADRAVAIAKERGAL